MAKTANEEVLDATVRHQIKLLRFSNGEAQKAADLLAESDAELVKLLESGLTDTSRARLDGLLREVRRLRAAVAERIDAELQGDMDGLSGTEAEWEVSMLQGATPVALALNSVPPVVLKAVASSPINGIPLQGWLGKMAANDVSRIEQQINLGVLQGETIDQMVARIRGTKANGYKDGVLETTRREAEMIARTATNHVSTAARQATWDANADIISGVRWVATLDGRTSPVCQSRDGEVYPIDKGPRPPAHPNCRSTVAPVLHGEEIVGDRPTITDTRTRAQREVDFRAEAREAAGDKWKGMSVAERNAAIKARRTRWADENIGQAPTTTNYQTWLKGQSKAFQDDVLGPGKAQLFRDGLPLEKFVDEKGKPYSLSQLKAELEGDKLHVVQPGVGLKAKSLLQQGMTNQQVLDQIKAEYPDASTSLASVASYKSELNKAGALNVPEAKVPSGALKQAKNVKAVVENLEQALPANVKHAIGGQWYTVVEDLDGAPGAYGYYQAGKGVTLSGKKLAAVSTAQAQQAAAHELGHLLHKQHDLLLPDDVLAAVKASAKGLSPDARKLYSYYLSSADELVAEVYAQALSPSPMTSQGLSALEFNKAFGDAVEAAKKAMAGKFPPAPVGLDVSFSTLTDFQKTALKKLVNGEVQAPSWYKTSKSVLDYVNDPESGWAWLPKKLTAQDLAVIKAGGLTDEALAATAKAPLPGGPVLPFEVAGKHTTVSSLAKALLQQGMPDEQVLKSVLAEFPEAKTKLGSIQSYKSQLKKEGLLPNKAVGPVVHPKVIPGVAPVPASAEVAAAAPNAVAAVPSAVQLTAAELKAKGLELLKQGVMGNSDVATTLDKMFPLNAGQVKPSTVATWKSLWKKADPGGYAKASTLAEKSTVKAAVSGPVAPPKLLGQKLGPMSTKALENVKSVVAAGGSPEDAYNAMKSVFGSIQEPGASDLLELAKYQVASAKAAGKPYLDAAFAAPKGYTADPKLEGFIAGLDAKGKAALEAYKKAQAAGYGPVKTNKLVKQMAGYEPAASAKVKLKSAADYELSKVGATPQPASFGAKVAPSSPPPSSVDMTPVRPAATPRDGLPPPPRFNSQQRAAGLRKYAGSVETGELSSMNAQQHSLGLPELTAEEAASIRSYTGSTYRVLNDALRSGRYASDPHLQAYVDAAQHGLAKMPKYVGRSARGMNFGQAELEKVLSTYRKGAVVEDAAFVSSSYGEQAAFSGNVFLKINGRTGVNISSFSKYGSEREVLFMPGTRFRVEDVVQSNGRYTITMTEI